MYFLHESLCFLTNVNKIFFPKRREVLASLREGLSLRLNADEDTLVAADFFYFRDSHSITHAKHGRKIGIIGNI